MILLPLLWSWVRADIDTVLNDPALKGATVSVCVRDLEGNAVYERNPDLLMTPGSNQKLLTALFALSALGPDYVVSTRIWKQKDRIIVDSPGDPSMTKEILMRARMALGISGALDVYVQQAYRPGVPPSWELDDLPNKYAAPITAFTVDRGSFEVWAEDGKVSTPSRAYGIRLKVTEGSGKPVVEYSPFTGLINVQGQIPRTKTRLDTLAIARPDAAASWFLAGNFHETADLPSTPADVVITSRSLGNIVSECLTVSDNNFAEHLLLMAALKAGPLGKDPYPLAAKRETSFLTGTVGLSSTTFRITDGSGVSRHNLVTPRAITDLLLWASRQPFAALFREGLASPGRGTLKSRLSGIDFRGKTGTLDLVSALSGYVKTKSGKELVVSIMFNQCAAPLEVQHQIQDKIIEDLSGNGTIRAFVPNYAPRASFSSLGLAAVDRIR